MMKLTTKAIIIFILLALCTSPSLAGQASLNIDVRPYSSSEVDKLSATAFGISLAGWVSENDPEAHKTIGEYDPSWDALVGAITTQLQIWRELPQTQTRASSYMREMLLLEESGFLEEYVWIHHVDAKDEGGPEETELQTFKDWAAENVKGHVPRIEAVLVLEPST